MLLFIFNTPLHADELIINKKNSYPYRAIENRANTIRSEHKRINLKMSASRVIEILGEPDETLPLFEPKLKNPKQIGFTYWYLIQRLQNNGSVNEKNEKVVRISFDLNWTVTALDHWVFE